MKKETVIFGLELAGQSTDPSPPDAHSGESDSSSTLEQYTRDKFSVSHQIRLLENLLLGRQSKVRASECHELMVKLAEDRFTLAVVGQFKRGKSSLMNALIGRELLPTGVLPLTSAITILRYGPREQLVVTWEDSSFDRNEPLSALNNYVTEQGNPGNEKRVRAVYVEVPCPFLRRGLEFVDTPGIGSAIEANTATTYGFIPNCDAVVFVTGVDAPITEAELEFLRRLRRDVGKVFCVVNKIDLLQEPQRSQVISFVTAQIRNALGSSSVPIFPVSSRLAIAEHREADESLCKESGIAAFREVLSRFLSGERTAVLLRAIIERALKLLAAEQDDIRLAERALSMSTEARQQRLERIRLCFDVIRRTITESVESLKTGANAAIINSAIANLDDKIQLGVVGFAEGLLKSSALGDWGSAKSLTEVVGRSVKDGAEMQINEWLANRRHLVDSTLADIAADLRKATVDLLADIESVDGLAEGNVHQLEELKLTSDGAPAEQFRIRVGSWAPIPPRLIRYMPANMVRRHLGKWIRRSAEAYGSHLKEKAVGMLGNILAEQIGKLSTVVMEFVRSEENRLNGLIASPTATSQTMTNISLAKQQEHARQIEDAMTLLLRPLNERVGLTSSDERIRPRGTESRPFLPEFVPSRVTRETLTRNLRAGGCPVCRQLTRVLFDFFANWQHLLAADDAAQRQYAQEFGFCPLHTWQLASISSPRGMSAGYPRLTERLCAELRLLGNSDAIAQRTAQLVPHVGSCRVCGMLTSVQRDCIPILNGLLETDGDRRIYAAAHGVCLRHLPSLLAAVGDSATRHFLIDEAAAHLEILGEDMQSFALKQEATRRELINSNEQSALRVALEKIVGLKSLCFPWEFDEVN